MIVLLVALGAAVGAPLRYLVDRAVQARHDSLFPWGTFAVNTTESQMGPRAGPRPPPPRPTSRDQQISTDDRQD